MMFFSFRHDRDIKGRSRPEDRRRAGRNRRAEAPESLEERALLAGTFSPLAQLSPNFSNTMMLETDGTVLMQGSGVSKNWYRLTPNSSGSYTGGTWSQVASMGLQRLYFGSNVLPDGRVFVVGGEYSGPYGVSNITNTGEIYNPVTNSWSNIATYPNSAFGDDPTEVLPDGRVLAGDIFSAQTHFYDPNTNAWSLAGTKLRSDRSDEEAWVKLSDNSILSYDIFSSISTGVGHAQRYIPSSNTWVDAGIVPVQLSSGAVGEELGPGFLLPDGRVFYLGANGNTAYYTESSNSWVAGPVIPSGLGADDAPGAMLPDGKILFTADRPLFNGPSHLFEFDPTTNVYTDLTSSLPTNYLSGPSYVDRMLVLPTGQVLLNNGGSQLEVYTPDLPPVAASTPTISSITGNPDGSYTLTGTGLNGISEGAAYGDDAEMSSNYPIVRFTDSSSRVFYARTFGWSGLVSTGSTPQTTKFTLPVGLAAGTYSVAVAANGSPSAPFTFTIPTQSGDPAPTVAVAASATPNPDPGTTAALSVLGADTAGESTLYYTWTATTVPPGAAAPSFSTNATNAAKNDTVTFSHAGSYTLTVTATNLAGLSVNSSVTVNVTQTFSRISVAPTPVNVAPNATRQLTATGLDQFGLSLATQPGFTWTLTSGNGSVTSTGLYTAPPTGTLATVTATSGVLSASASVFVLTPPLVTQDIGGPIIAGAAGDDSNGNYKLLASGSDIYGTSDQFRFAYTTLTGDGTLIARVVTEQNTNTFAKAGVMFRNDLTAGSANAFMAITPGAGAAFQARTAASGSTTSVGTAGKAAPYWVRLVRSGNLFTGSYSPDGVNWTVESSATISMASTAYVGLALTSHDQVTLNTTIFDHLNLNSAPTVAVVATATPNPVTGSTTTLSALGADLAGESNLTYTWAATSIPAGAPNPTFSINGTNAAKNDLVTFFKDGNYTFNVTIANSAGFSVTSAVAVSVIDAPPTIVTTPSGFTASFSEPFNPATLNLYTTAAVDLGPPDVTLVGASTGPVYGSLIVDPSNQRITFVATGGVLAPDSYTLTLRSASDGFVDGDGDLLAGSDGIPGHDFTTTFTVAPSSARVISIPDFARGPGQPVNLPATASGIPLSIGDGTGVTSISLTITYNPALLTITGANLGASAPAGASVTINTSTPGSAVLTFTSPTALPAGAGTFATLIASVPASAPYRSGEALALGGIAVNGGAIAAIGDAAIHSVDYLGDVAGLAGYSGQDVTLLRRVLVGTDSGFAAFPLLDPTIEGDILGTGSLNSQDVSLLRLYLTGGSVPQIPDLPTPGPGPRARAPIDGLATIAEPPAALVGLSSGVSAPAVVDRAIESIRGGTVPIPSTIPDTSAAPEALVVGSRKRSKDLGASITLSVPDGPLSR